ncbi:Helix-turn-helix, type 11 domain protein [Methanococcus maripaludis C5]|uniref:Helix-turn-helix, type 11 domain protein n=1 Tax=Methanococcus maripaludis (strain C5 / ATCC BAA-1333) TaxID=402880 RepID=A4FXC6_METM5|nr:winged helix-turn-helix transcriptional regulator [Methanococcus maripaludis]ABO34855.1 Helix-turn-helix, type 11 domain protein [Methanococcus maripaludis C5]
MKKRNITEFQILSEVVRKQPHIKQKEIADILGITVQGVSEHMRNLIREEQIKNRGRGEYVITEKGMASLKTWISDFKNYLNDVNQNLYRYKDVWPAIASENVNPGETVGVYMKKGVIYVSKNIESDATAKVFYGGNSGEDVAIHEIQGHIDVQNGKVIFLKIPSEVMGGSRNVDYDIVKSTFEEYPDAVVATAGTVGTVIVNKLEIHPDIRFAVSEGIVSACNRGCDVIAIITGKMAEKIIKTVDKNKISYTLLNASKTTDSYEQPMFS